MTAPLLAVEGLRKSFVLRSPLLGRRRGLVHAVDDVSFAIHPGETFGLVGESGCGKSTLAKTIAGILEPSAGEVRFEGAAMARLPEGERRRYRAQLQYVHQDAGASLDPWWKVSWLLHEPLLAHAWPTLRDRRRRVGEMLAAVGLDRDHLGRYPHELSGGQQRRIALARVLMLRPRLVIFDEPTAGLDVSVQANVVALLDELKTRFGLTYIVISHDLGLVRAICDRVAVMYLGRIVESGKTDVVLAEPRHPYTRALLDAIPRPRIEARDDAILLEGELPSPGQLPSGCRFRARCPVGREDPCAFVEPRLSPVGDRLVACHFADPQGESA